MLLTTREISPEQFHAQTGWEIKPQGACKGDVCVPLPNGFNLPDVADRLGMAVVEDSSLGLVAVGPESLNGRALVTAQAPELALKDIAGNEFHLSSLRGQKVLVVSWAPY